VGGISALSEPVAGTYSGRNLSGGGSKVSPGPYKPSWVDRLIRLVDRRRWSKLAFYPLLLLAAELLLHAAVWIDGVRDFGQVHGSMAVNALLVLVPFGFIHSLEVAARRSLDSFRLAIADKPEELTAIRYRMTEMPARPVMWITLISAAITIAGIASGDISVYDGISSPVSYLLAGLAVAFVYSLGPVLFYFVYRMLRTVSKAYELVDEVNLLDQRPLYALSRLSMLAGVLWLVVVNFDIVLGIFDPQEVTTTETVTNLIGTGIGILLAFALFLLPLVGIHRRLRQAKYDLIQQNSRAIDRLRMRLYEAVDADDVERSEKLDRGLNSLFRLRDELEKVPTWPWRPGSFRTFLTAVLLPIVVWVTQEILTEFF
jgi:hypothetical protein